MINVVFLLLVICEIFQLVNRIFIRNFLVINCLVINKGYPTNLSEKSVENIEIILEPTTRKRKYPLNDTMNCILYVNKTGCQWRMTSKDIFPHNIVLYYFTKWRREDVFEDIMDTLRENLRVSLRRKAQASASRTRGVPRPPNPSTRSAA